MARQAESAKAGGTGRGTRGRALPREDLRCGNVLVCGRE